jgi:DNA-binding response OmpR family regulator
MIDRHTMEDVSRGAETSDGAGVASEAREFSTGAPARRQLPPRAEPIRTANVEVRPDEYQVLIDGRRLALTVREFEVLLMLAENEDRVVHRTHLYEAIWGGKMKYRERAIDVFVRKIRTKLAAAAPDWVYLHTHFGVGYRFAPEQRRYGREPHDQPPAQRR